MERLPRDDPLLQPRHSTRLAGAGVLRWEGVLTSNTIKLFHRDSTQQEILVLNY